MSQNSLVLPTTGTVSGLAFVEDVNAALDALASANSGSSAPANAAGSTAVAGQHWLDTSTTPPHMRLYDGVNWLDLGAVDTSGHQWKPPIGGGLNTLASAATVDLGSVADSYVVISGTTAITSFGSSMAPGTRKTVRFSGSLALTYNATSMILPTGASVLTSVGDTADVIALGGGNFIVVAYTPAAGAMPPGFIGDYAGSAAPSGWLLCYGQAVSRTTYAALFGAISTTYGVGDGSTTFNLPDCRGRAILGLDNMGGSAANRITAGGSGITGTTLGATGGAETVTLTTPQIPSHSHTATVTDPGHTHTITNQGTNLSGTIAPNGGGALNVNASLSANSNTTGISVSNSNTGGGGAHNNVQPAIMANKIIKY
jgi:microcystin-dependent protein